MRVSDAITVPSPVARLRWIALIAAALLTAYGEFELATLVGFTPWLAWLLPVALDVYAFCAFAAGRARIDTLAALGLMIVCQALAHLLASGLLPVHWTLVIAVSAVAPIICWRVHHLGEHTAAPAAPSTGGTPSAAATPSAATANTPSPDDVPPPEPTGPTTSDRRPAAGRQTRRPVAHTRQLAAEITAAEPGITRERLAARLDITPRRLRAVLNTGAANRALVEATTR